MLHLFLQPILHTQQRLFIQSSLPRVTGQLSKARRGDKAVLTVPPHSMSIHEISIPVDNMDIERKGADDA